MKLPKRSIILVFLFLLGCGTAEARRNTAVALVYDGPGVCEDGCVDAAMEAARLAGLKPKRFKADALTEESSEESVSNLFKNVKVWIQPGGKGNYALWSLNTRLRAELLKFIENGGGYVGFCGGAFMATEVISRHGGWGLGIFPGMSYLFRGTTSLGRGFLYALEPVTWNGKKYQMYFEGGPYLVFTPDPSIEVVATYANDAVAAARTTYKKGRVFITGLHPEAPIEWTKEDEIVDSDGSEQHLAVEMIQWAAKMIGPEPVPKKTGD